MHTQTTRRPFHNPVLASSSSSSSSSRAAATTIVTKCLYHNHPCSKYVSRRQGERHFSNNKNNNNIIVREVVVVIASLLKFRRIVLWKDCDNWHNMPLDETVSISRVASRRHPFSSVLLRQRQHKIQLPVVGHWSGTC